MLQKQQLNHWKTCRKNCECHRHSLVDEHVKDNRAMPNLRASWRIAVKNSNQLVFPTKRQTRQATKSHMNEQRKPVFQKMFDSMHNISPNHQKNIRLWCLCFQKGKSTDPEVETTEQFYRKLSQKCCGPNIGNKIPSMPDDQTQQNETTWFSNICRTTK